MSDSIIDTLQALIMQNGLGYIDVDAKKVTFCNDKLVEIFDWYKAHTKKMILHENTKKLVEEILDKIKKELDKEAE